eukprot:GGOE01011148.1.p1 GENE.GGOE01011148.1~~GGOE01011148.1.p1  ORF type:complete len:295 (-),score=36.04 GGOE01011148.1:439-1215(-)
MHADRPPNVRVARPLSPPPPPPPDDDDDDSRALILQQATAAVSEGHRPPFSNPSPVRRPSPIPRRMSAADFISSTPATSPAVGPSPTGFTYQQVFYYLPPRNRLDKSSFPAALDPYGTDEEPRTTPTPSPRPFPTASFRNPTITSQGIRRFSLPLPTTFHSSSEYQLHPSLGSASGMLHGALGLPPFTKPANWDSLTPREAAALRYLQDPILMDGEVAPSIPRSVIDVTPRPFQLPALEPVPMDHYRSSLRHYPAYVR